MNVTVIAINALALALLAVSFFKDRAKTVQSLRSALRSRAGLAPTLLGILVVIGLIMGFLTSATIGKILGEGSGIIGVLTAALLGSVLHIPSLVSFPLGGSLLRSGASVTVIAVFITTLTMVGFMTLPMEINILGKRFTHQDPARTRGAAVPRLALYACPLRLCGRRRLRDGPNIPALAGQKAGRRVD